MAPRYRLIKYVLRSKSIPLSENIDAFPDSRLCRVRRCSLQEPASALDGILSRIIMTPFAPIQARIWPYPPGIWRMAGTKRPERTPMPLRFTGCPLRGDHIGYILVANHRLLPQLDSYMSLSVFLSFRRCPKHPNTLPFHSLPRLPNLETLR